MDELEGELIIAVPARPAVQDHRPVHTVINDALEQQPQRQRRQRPLDANDWGGDLGEVLRPAIPARAQQQQNTNGEANELSPRTAVALGLRSHAQRNVAHMDEWGGDLGSLMASAANISRQRPSAQIASQQSGDGVAAHSSVSDAYSNASTNRRQSRPQRR